MTRTPMIETPHVAILLASYNGATHLPQQLDSFATQDHANWSLIVSDDGSRDATRDIVAEFAAGRDHEQVTLHDGPRAGATQNFLSLLENAPVGQYLALSDQDDLWLPRKLARAVEALSGKADRPALYCARTIICDKNLNRLRELRLFPRLHQFRNALVQACTAGNTIVLNPAAAALARAAAAAARAAHVVSHDWWLYHLIAGAGGHVIWDREPVLLYRQHASNEMGRNDTLPAMMRRLSMLFGGDYRDWLGQNIVAMRGVDGLLSAENRAVLNGFAAALGQPGPAAAAQMRRLGLFRQDRPSQAALYLAAMAGRLRQELPSNPSR